MDLNTVTAVRPARTRTDLAALDDRTAVLQVAVVPRFSLSVTPTTLGGLGELYAGVRDRGVYFHSHLSENDTPPE